MNGVVSAYVVLMINVHIVVKKTTSFRFIPSHAWITDFPAIILLESRYR